jgi:hypothetical protein
VPVCTTGGPPARVTVTPKSSVPLLRTVDGNACQLTVAVLPPAMFPSTRTGRSTVGLPPLAPGSNTMLARTSSAWIVERFSISTTTSRDADVAPCGEYFSG